MQMVLPSEKVVIVCVCVLAVVQPFSQAHEMLPSSDQLPGGQSSHSPDVPANAPAVHSSHTVLPFCNHTRMARINL